MKLMICGKGGSGKSTVIALLAQGYASLGKRVVVVDTDASNVGLHRILGTASPPDFCGDFKDRAAMMAALRARHETPASGGTLGARASTQTERVAMHRQMMGSTEPTLGVWDYDRLPDHCTARNGNIKLVSTGKFQSPAEYGKGRWVGMTRQFFAGYRVAAEDRVLVDTDAGIEHLARGMGAVCDAIVDVVDPSYESILHASTITRIMKVPVYFILNKTTPDSASFLRASMPAGVPIIGDFPRDSGIFSAGLNGSQMPALEEARSVLHVLETLHCAGEGRKAVT